MATLLEALEKSSTLRRCSGSDPISRKNACLISSTATYFRLSKSVRVVGDCVFCLTFVILSDKCYRRDDQRATEEVALGRGSPGMKLPFVDWVRTQYYRHDLQAPIKPSCIQFANNGLIKNSVQAGEFPTHYLLPLLAFAVASWIIREKIIYPLRAWIIQCLYRVFMPSSCRIDRVHECLCSQESTLLERELKVSADQIWIVVVLR